MKYGTHYGYWGDNLNALSYVDSVKRAKKVGLDILEIGADHLEVMSDEEIKEIRDIAEELGITITTNSGPAQDQDLASADPAIRANGVKFLTNVMRNMKKIGSDTFVGAIYSYWPCQFLDLDKEAAWERSIAGMKEVAKVAKELDILICLEVLNRYETFILTDCKEALKYCEQVGSDNVVLLLDTFYMNIEENNIAEAIRLAGNKLGHLHVGESNRKLPGMGSLPWREIGRALRDIGYDRYVVMEPFMKTGGGIGEAIKVWRDLSNDADEDKMDQYIADALVFLKHEFTFEK